MNIESIDTLQEALRKQLYVAGRGLATAVFLALKLQRPLFLEGEPGVGKTEIAKVLAGLLDTNLIRLQCYEGLDINQAVYEWNYTRQMLHIRLLEAQGQRADEAELFGEAFLLERPLLQAIRHHNQRPPILLIDEIDRSDEEFEAFLLEILSDFQITIPEIGTIRPPAPLSSSSPPTAPAKSTTPSSGAASTTGSTIPALRKSWKLCRPKCPRRRPNWPRK
jgi:MoxR-like ATPase